MTSHSRSQNRGEITFVLPGDGLPRDALPSRPIAATPLKLGPGLRLLPPDEVVALVAGEVVTDERKGAVWVEGTGGGRYLPQPNDLVIATIHHSNPEFYHCLLSPHASLATLPQLSFAGASKKTRPQLGPGALVYARVVTAGKWAETELECVNASTGKGDGLGELKGGMVWDVSLGMARRLLLALGSEKGAGVAGIVLLEELVAQGVAFELAVGRNGRVWGDAEGGDVGKTVLVGRVLVETDRQRLGVEEQRKLVRRLLRGL